MGKFSELSKRLKRAEAQLAHGSPDARSKDEITRRLVDSRGVGIHELDDKDMDDFWDLFTSVPIVREPIRAFATEVVAPGVTVDAGSEEDANELENWLSHSAIVHGEVDKPFRLLLKALVIQREVRGTALVEKVPLEGSDELYGFKAIPVHTVKQYTRPGQNILLAPDEDVSKLESDDFVLKDNGDVAAYVQFDGTLQAGFNSQEIPFTRDEIIKLTRDADVGDVFGNSRLEAVEDRINSLTDKLDANDEAIFSKAFKFWLFKFGVGEDGPWDPDDISTFMDNHKASNFAPGMKQGVQGDVEIETIEGEVAEGLEAFLDFDINWIISAMPLPKYALGGFEENVNQFVSRSQETRVENQIREARMEIEDEFTAVLKEKAEELGIDPEPVRLNLGSDGMNDPRTDFTRPPASSERERKRNQEIREGEEDDEEDQGVWAVRKFESEELQDSTFVSTRSEQSQLEELAEEFVLDARNLILDRLESDLPRIMEDTNPSLNTIDRTISFSISQASRNNRLSSESFPSFKGATSKTLESLSESGVDTNTSFSLEDRRMAQTFAEEFKNSSEDAAEDMGATIRAIARNGFRKGATISDIVARVESKFSNAKISNRASIISHMAVKNSTETIKLREFERDDNVIGVRVSNPCNLNTTPLCRDLAGCGEEGAATASFSEGDIASQLQAQVDEEFLFDGFSPLPPVPAFHHGCSSVLEPIFSEES